MSTSLLMGMIAPAYKQSDPLEKVRSTVTTVTDDAPSVATSTPEAGRLETDANTDGGLTPHQVAPLTVERSRYPSATAHTATGGHNVGVNARQSSAGTAAAREAAGAWGHGSISYEDSMTRPEDGVAFSEEYFKREHRGPNEEVSAYMTTSNSVDQKTLDDVQSAGKARAADKANVNIYNEMYSNFMNGTGAK